MSEAKVRVSLSDGVVELEGSETFVREQLEKFREVIHARLSAVSRAKNTPSPKGDETEKNDGNESGEGENLDDVFAATDEGIQILKDIPGDSGPQKHQNAAKLLLWGLSKLKGKDSALFEDVRAVCKAHGFYQANNLAKYLKDDKASFVFGGSGKKQTLKLTVPGAKAAAKLAADLRAASAE